LFIVGMLAGYYAAYAFGLLRWRREVELNGSRAPRKASTPNGFNGVSPVQPETAALGPCFAPEERIAMREAASHQNAIHRHRFRSRIRRLRQVLRPSHRRVRVARVLNVCDRPHHETTW